MSRSVQDVAKMLQQIMAEKFGGKTDTRFKISRERLAQLAGRKILHTSYLSDLSDVCIEGGLLFINLDNFFAVQELDVVERYRSVPPYIVSKLIAATSSIE